MIAVIDIGTNTFHLLIARIIDEEHYEIVFRESRFVRIARDGISPISPASLQRALDTLGHFVDVMKDYDITSLRVVGTEALRSASNAGELLRKAHDLYGLSIEIISGEEEARLIFEGTIHAIPNYREPYLIMDIGGGSVEFIIAQDEKILWWGSFRLGVQYLYLKYNDNDPIHHTEISQLRNDLTDTLQPLKEAITQHRPVRLVGSSGSFETLLSLAGVASEANYIGLSPKVFREIFDRLIHTTLDERKAHPAIPVDRAELIVIGFLLIEYVLTLFPVKEIVVSSFALREGLLYSGQGYGKLADS